MCSALQFRAAFERPADVLRTKLTLAPIIVGRRNAIRCWALSPNYVDNDVPEFMSFYSGLFQLCNAVFQLGVDAATRFNQTLHDLAELLSIQLNPRFKR